ncbi:BTB-domain-containing protein [Rhizophagus irregularis]|uniref:BTB-domain-containing protein n=1 Tax=Rhizophagus irregularis TaxID=588596 RepID=A0A2N1ME79_9GLOM|nr:BTB-domain-containing protein [Rhizophagus irregularis]
MISFFYSNLSKDFSLILNDADDYNVTIKVGENENTKEFRAHSVILRARSPYFKGALSSTWITKKNDMIIFHKPNIAPNIFDMILRYIYLGELDLTEQPGEDILKLLIASDELLLEELVEYSRDYLIKHQRNWIQKKFVLIHNTACKYTRNFDSKIIKPKLAKIILKWINKEDFWISRYKFNLIYRGSIDGNHLKNKCKGQVESLVLVKVKQASKIFGGYSSIGFNSIGDSLLQDTQNMKISRVIKYDKAIYDYYTIGFNFGFNSLYINDCQHLQAYNLHHYYENNINTEMVYNIEEIETFVIVKQ